MLNKAFGTTKRPSDRLLCKELSVARNRYAEICHPIGIYFKIGEQVIFEASNMHIK